MTTLFVSFRGEDPAQANGKTKPAHVINPIQNIVAFPDGQHSFEILQPPAASSIELCELRGFLFLDGDLYVANGNKHQHQILRFKPARDPGQWQYHSTVAVDSLTHPFDVIPGFNDTLFVSSQDDNTVTVYRRSGKDGKVFAKGFHAVRGLAYDGTYLYVADAGDAKHPGRVKFYDAQGKKLGHLTSATAGTKPVHLLYDSAHGWLFIGDETLGVQIYNPATEAGPSTLISSKEASIDHTAGLALDLTSDTTGTLYVASRVGQQVLSFPLDFSSGTPKLSGKSAVALDGLEDEPEFVGLEAGPFG